MHHALYLEEILLNIFGHCYGPSGSESISKDHTSCATADLAALARACRTFKEPALDVLWTELADLSPLARCLPELSRRVYPGYTWYSFSRPPKQVEWDVIRGYARRVRSVLDFSRGLTWESVKILLNPATPGPIFLNLRILRWEFMGETFPLMRHLAVSSLTSLDINFVFGDLLPFHAFPDSLGDLCPNIRRFRALMRRPLPSSDEDISTLIRRWTNLQVVCCPYVSFDVHTLEHLSYTPSLTSLSFTLSSEVTDHIASSNSILLFSKVHNLEICSPSLELISQLLPHIRLPTVASLAVYVDACPSKYTLKTYLNTLENICTPRSLVSLKLIQTQSPTFAHLAFERNTLSLEDLRPCMVFNSLSCLVINTPSIISLTDEDLFVMTSAWPRLEHLLINEDWGWKTQGGITPFGLVQLLQKLGSLHHICLAIDTRGFTYTDLPLSVESALFILRTLRSLNVTDSMIQPECVDALGTLFAGILQPHTTVSSLYWNNAVMADRLDSEISRNLWKDVFVKAYGKAKAYYTQRTPISRRV